MEDDYAAASVEKSQWKNKVFHIEPATSLGTNCIKICLPGKQILSKRKGLWEVLGSDPEGKKPLERPPENQPENQLEISYTGKSPKIGSLDMS